MVTQSITKYTFYVHCQQRLQIEINIMQHLFLKYGLIIKQCRCYCNHLPITTHNVTSIDDLYDKLPKSRMNGPSLIKSHHQSLITIRNQLISKTIELKKKTAMIDEHKCKMCLSIDKIKYC